MKITSAIFALLIAISTATHSTAQDKPAPTPVDGKIEWIFDYEKGKQLAKESGKPMFVVFRCER